MNKQRKVLITTTYNEMGIIIDTKVEEVTQTNLQPASTDTISRAKAIEALNKAKTVRSESGELFVAKINAQMNIDALPSAELGTNLAEVGADLISRQAAIDEIYEWIKAFRESGHKQSAADARLIQDGIIQLPSAERDTAEWIESDGQKILLENSIKKGEVWRVCSKCGAGFMIGYKYECDKAYHETFHNFCPNCGADMRQGEQDG